MNRGLVSKNDLIFQGTFEILEEKSGCYKMRALLDGIENGSTLVGKEGWNTLAKILIFSLRRIALICGT